jgi:hypothetical protein
MVSTHALSKFVLLQRRAEKEQCFKGAPQKNARLCHHAALGHDDGALKDLDAANKERAREQVLPAPGDSGDMWQQSLRKVAHPIC